MAILITELSWTVYQKKIKKNKFLSVFNSLFRLLLTFFFRFRLNIIDHSHFAFSFSSQKQSAANWFNSHWKLTCFCFC